MNDWRSKVQMSRRDGFKAAGVIIGLLFGCILAVWVLSRCMRHDPAPPRNVPPIPKPFPTPKAPATP